MKRSFEEERLQLLDQSDYYLKAADRVSDQLTKSSLLYLSLSSLYKAEQITLTVNDNNDDTIKIDQNCDSDQISDSFEYSVYNGRIRTSNNNCNGGMDSINKLKTGSVISDLLELERKLADIDLFNINKPTNTLPNNNTASNNLLKDSFILLSAASQKIKNESIIAGDLHNNSYGKSISKSEDNSNSNLFEWSTINPCTINDNNNSLGLLKEQIGSSLAINNNNSSTIHNDNSQLYEDNVMRLLQCINTLNEENIILMKRNETLNSIEIDRLKVMNEIEEFKAEFSKKFRKLRYVLDDFSKQYPHENNPANAYKLLAKDISSKPNDEVRTLIKRQENLERMIQALLDRLERSKTEMNEKDRTIAKYLQKLEAKIDKNIDK